MIQAQHEGAERAILVHLEVYYAHERENPQEFRELALSAGAQIASLQSVTIHQPSARYLIGSGKVEQLRELVVQQQAQLIIFNSTLTPSQERNLERALECRVIDRVGLILDIFAQRAQTYEGKLQVELAQLEYISTRLVRSRSDLSRQQGGIGLRGPGETQLETDRRLLRARVRQIKARLEKVRSQRELARRSRKRAEIPGVSLVGYTNAGKSTLFNAMADSAVYAANQLFATLDPTVRRVQVANIGPITLADTVGFIRHLPHKLVEAFRATLEETANADLLLHVVDAQAAERDEQITQVQQVLKEIGAEQVPVLEVYNKIDALPEVEPCIQRDAQAKPVRVWLSARTGQGLDLLHQAIAELLTEDTFTGQVQLPHSMGRLRAQLFELGAVQREWYSKQGESCLQVRVPTQELNRLLSEQGMEFAVFSEHCVLKHAK